MIKRTLYFGNPIYLHSSNHQLCWQVLDSKKNIEAIIKPAQFLNATPEDDFMNGIDILHNTLSQPNKTTSHYASKDTSLQGSIPIEDIGVVILDDAQITISHSLIAKLLANNVALITCNDTHHPTGLMLNLDGHTLQSQRWQAQLQATVPLKKQLWQQTVQCKIANQATLLNIQLIETGNMRK
jgi:CRISP-associated protein Cas1